jgi:hypothetical protein
MGAIEHLWPRRNSVGLSPVMVRYLTMTGILEDCSLFDPLALRYRRVNGSFSEQISIEATEGPHAHCRS